MHGRPRKSAKPDEEEASSIAKAQKLRSLQSQFLSNHHNCSYTKEALDLSAKLLEANPESYTAWNYRKLAVHHRVAESNSDPDSLKSILDEELRVVEIALRQNFKSYGAWHHRKWVLSKGHSSIDHELRLLDRFQKADNRNFHAWNYRRFVSKLMNRSEEDELNYTTDMISANFSNYSAWHNRSVLLSSLLEKKVDSFFPKEKVLNKEFDLVHNAIFTDPDDQSVWFYYLWLLDQTVKEDSPLLVSSWPSHGSDITLFSDGFCSAFELHPFRIFQSDSGTFPIVLYFSQPVEGVSSATVTVESSICSNSDLIWKPLSTNNTNTGQVWVTHVKILEKELVTWPGAYSVVVSLENSQGIISLSGFPCSHKTRIAFKVKADESNEEHNDDKISWKDENFHAYTSQSQESNSGVFSLGPLTVDDDFEPKTSEWREETIANEIACFGELLDCKIGKLTLARLLNAQNAILSRSPNKEVNIQEILKLYSDLAELDPLHSDYYKDETSLVLLQQVASSAESLLSYCHRFGNSVCLRLNNLSLTRVGSADKLLWVQMLDLSHNKLHSIEGLEALQVLSCLNLSYNKLSSITALGPIRLLKSLKVLDVSYNEIGSHSIDTTRYLCPSPLSNSKEIDLESKEIVVSKYWEAFIVFKGLNLKQLDILGNKIAGKQFRSFLVRFVPTIKWLDGELVH